MRFWATYLVELLLFITLENTISNKSGFKRPLPSTQIRITWLYFSWQLFPSCKSEGISCTSIFPTLRHNQGYRFYCLRHNEKIKHQVVRKKPFNEAHCKRNENNGQKPLKGKRRILVGKKKYVWGFCLQFQLLLVWKVGSTLRPASLLLLLDICHVCLPVWKLRYKISIRSPRVTAEVCFLPIKAAIKGQL